MEGITEAQLTILQSIADKDGTHSETRQCILRGIQQIGWLHEILSDHEKDVASIKPK